jgi:hypothetical protein
MEFEDGKIFSYFSNLNKIVLLDLSTGKFLRNADYKSLQSEGYLVPRIWKYRISLDKKNYEIEVANTLFGSFDLRNQFDVSVREI